MHYIISDTLTVFDPWKFKDCEEKKIQKKKVKKNDFFFYILF